MDSATFWHLVDRTRPTAWEPREHVSRLDEALRGLDLEEVLAWMQHLGDAIDDARRHDLADACTVAHGLRYIGDDGFGEFIDWLILQGQANYERVLSEPDELAALDLKGTPSTRLRLLATDIFLERTGRPPPYQSRPYAIRGESIRDAHELQRRYPKLWKMGMAAPVQQPLKVLLQQMRDPADPLLQAISAVQVWGRTGEAELAGC